MICSSLSESQTRQNLRWWWWWWLTAKKIEKKLFSVVSAWNHIKTQCECDNCRTNCFYCVKPDIKCDGSYRAQKLHLIISFWFWQKRSWKIGLIEAPNSDKYLSNGILQNSFSISNLEVLFLYPYNQSETYHTYNYDKIEHRNKACLIDGEYYILSM